MVSVISSLESRHDKIKQLLTCPICNKLLRQVTAIDECLHIFCRKCITAKFTEEKLNKCPVCEVDLGVFPLQKLRADYRWQSIRNSVKFKRRQFVERGLIQRKKSNQVSDAKPPAEVVWPSSKSLSLINEAEDEEDEDDDDEDEDEDEEYCPLPAMRRKEKSISSVLRAEKRAARKSSRRRGGRGRTKSNKPPRRSSSSSSSSSSSLVAYVPTTKESSSNPVKPGNGEHGTKQNIKPSMHEELSSIYDKKGKREMNPSLKFLDHIPSTTTTSRDAIINMSAPPSQPHPDITQETTEDHEEDNSANNKGRKGKERDHHDHQSDGETTASVSRNNIASRSCVRRSRRGGGGGGGREKRPVVTEDLNLPAQVVLDASSSKCFRSNHIWFSLVASDYQDDSVRLPPLPPYYVMIKDSNMPASFLRKYLVKKLNLSSENEVELTMRGRPISLDGPVDKLVNLWKETTPELEKKPAMVGDSAEEYVMVVTYRRSATTLPC